MAVTPTVRINVSGARGPEGPVGQTGPAENSYFTVAALAAGPVSNMSAILTEAGRAGLFVLRDYADLADEVAGDPDQAFYIRSTSDPDKVWVRQTNQTNPVDDGLWDPDADIVDDGEWG